MNKSFRREASFKINRLINQSNQHCGHDGPIQRMLFDRERFLDWLEKEMLEAVQAGVEATRSGIAKARSEKSKHGHRWGTQ